MNALSNSEKKIAFSVLLIAFCGLLGTDLYLPSMPAIMAYMHTDKAHIQLSVSLFFLGMSGSLLFYGPLSDKYGRKPIILFGIGLAFLASLCTLFASNIHSFLIFRLLQGVGCGVSFGLGRTIIADVFHGPRLASMAAYMGMFAMLSPLIAPTVGGYLETYGGWRMNFVALALCLLTVFLVCFFWCPETNVHKNPQAFTPKGLYHSYRTLLSHSVFMGCCLMTAIATAVTTVYLTLGAVLLQTTFHLSPIAYGWVTLSTGAGAIIGRIITPFCIRFWGSVTSIFLGTCLFIFAGLLLWYMTLWHVESLTWLMSSVFIVMMGQALIAPNAAALALSPFHDKRGAAGALYGSTQMLGGFLCGTLVAVLSYPSITILWSSYLILGLIALGIYFTLVRDKNGQKIP